VTSGDSHAGVTLRTAAGAAHQGTVSIEWDGRAAQQTIDAAKNNKPDAAERFGFFLHFLAPYNQTVQPRGSEAVEIAIVRMDDLNIEANITGTATGEGGTVQINGVIKVHRDTSGQKVSGSWENCDPGIHDKLVGAEWRSPSECEAKFDGYVREALMPAFSRLESAFTQGDWDEVRKPKFRQITAIERGSEGNAFSLQASQDGMIRYEFRLKPGSEQAKRNQAAISAVTQKMAEAMKSPAASEAFQAEMARVTHETEGSGSIAISVAINSGPFEIENFQGSIKPVAITGAGYAISVPYAQSRGGGDIGSSHETTYVFLGSWTPALATKSGGADTRIAVKPTVSPKAGPLAVQNIRVEIQAGTELAQTAIGLVDWDALRRLTATK
jgi:hypothetical protein